MSNGREPDELDEEDIDEDELLAMLSPEELQELQSEMDVIIAPDERVPVGQRQKDQTEKTPTGTFDHRSLVDYMYWEKESKRMLEEERVPATLLPSQKTLREEAERKEKEENTDTVNYEEYEVIEEVIEEEAVGSENGEEIIEEIIEEIVEVVDEPDEKGEEEEVKDEREVQLPVNKEEHENTDKLLDPEDNIVETVKENSSDGDQSSPDKMKSLAPGPSTSPLQEKEEIRTIDSLLPKDASEATEINETSDNLPPKEERKINKLNIPKLSLNNIKMTSRPSGNETNLESTLDKIRNNNPSINEVNLNNIENIPKDMLLDYVNGLKKNKHVKTFSIANTGVDENIAYNLANMLRENRSITTLNIESNFVTGKGIVAIIRCLQFNETLTELRFHNQRHMLGHHSEMEISRLLKANHTLLKMGYHFEQAGPRMVVTNLLTRNLDRQRQQRKEEQKQLQLRENRELMQTYERSLNLPPGLLEMLGYIPPIEVLQEYGLVPPSADISAWPKTQPQTEQPEPQRQPEPQKQPEPKKPLNHKRIPEQPSAEPANSLRDVQLKRTPKKRDPFLDQDPRDNRRPVNPGFQLRKTRRVEADSEQVIDERPNLTNVIRTLKPVPRRLPPKIDVTPRDQLLGAIKKSNVAFLKAVPLPKALESSETSLL